MRHTEIPFSFLARRDGKIRLFKHTTKKHLRTCPHCGMPVDDRFWPEHRERAHKIQKEGDVHAN